MNIVVITGRSRGIGASTAIECARRAMGVILTGHRNAAAEDGGWIDAQSIEVAGGYCA